MVPVFVAQRGSKSQPEVDVTAIRFARPANPGQALFNELIDKIIAGIPLANPDDLPASSLPYSYQLSMSVPYSSPAFISAKAFYYEYTGAAHGNSSTRNFNIDLTSAIVVKLADMFKPSAKPILV